MLLSPFLVGIFRTFLLKIITQRLRFQTGFPLPPISIRLYSLLWLESKNDREDTEN